MDGRETSREVERVAARWVARMDRGPLSAADDVRLKLWLAGDARRRGALLRAKALWLQAESVRDTGQLHELNVVRRQPAPAAPATRLRNPRRRRVLKWSSAAAASVVLAMFLVVAVPVPAAYATAKGEMRRVPLADGSTLTLNTASKVKVYDRSGRLRVKVERGEVFVEASATGRPLVIEVDGRRLDARASAFVVRKLEGQPTQVVVQRGEVESLPASTMVTASNRLSLPATRGRDTMTSVSPTQLQRELAWLQGKIAFQGETLSEAAAAFSRYSDTSIVIADPQLARMPVAGLFGANNPVGFGQAIAKVFDAEMRQENGKVILGGED